MGLKKLVWHKLYTDIGLLPNAMVFEKLVWHKLYIHSGFSPNRMMFEMTNSPSKSRLQPYSMDSNRVNAKSGYIQVRLQAKSVGGQATAPLYQRLLAMINS